MSIIRGLRFIKLTMTTRLSPDTPAPEPPVHLNSDLGSALIRVAENTIHRGFVIGGAALYDEVLKLPSSNVDRVLLTRIISPAFNECDVFMPDFLAEKSLANEPVWQRASHQELQAWVGFEVAEGVQEENGVHYEFQMWTRQS